MKQKIKNLEKNKFNTIEIILIVIITSITGFFLGELVFNNNKEVLIQKEQSQIMDVYNKLLKEYYNKTTKEELEDAAIKGMIESLGDEYSNFLDKEVAENFNTELNGEFEGIGISIFEDTDKLATVAEVFKNSPADVAGIKVGDKIKKINDESTANMTTEEISKKIKAFKNEFKLTVQRDKEEIVVSLKLSKVEIPSIETKVYEENGKKIGYIKILLFALNTDEQFSKALIELENQKIDSLIIDLRDNTGGHLETTVNIASEFLNKNQIVTQIKGKSKIEKIYSNKNKNRKINLIVLVNGNSASGSEMLAASLQEEYKATLIGEKTFGKGTVQRAYMLGNGKMLKYTTEEWLTSKGNSINKIGIKPTIEEKLNIKYYETYLEKDDNQLQKAIEILKDK